MKTISVTKNGQNLLSNLPKKKHVLEIYFENKFIIYQFNKIRLP